MADLLKRETVERVRLEFCDQAQTDRSRDFINGLPLETVHKEALVEVAKRERWDDEYASVSDALRRLTEDKVAQKMKGLANAAVRSGREMMLNASKYALGEGDKIIRRALAVKLRNKEGRALTDSELGDGFFNGRLRLLRSYVDLANESQRVMAGALGLTSAISDMLPSDGELGGGSPEMRATLESMRRLESELDAMKQSPRTLN